MIDGFVRVAAATPRVEVADCEGNVSRMEEMLRQAVTENVQLLCFPELSVTAYTCLDLFSSQTLLDGAEKALLELIRNTADTDIFALVGAPLRLGDRLVNAAVAFQKGQILGVVPKSYLPNYKEFQERRWFSPASELREESILIGGKSYPLSSRMLFTAGEAIVGLEICEDLWMPVPPSSILAMEGANLLFNLSASNELTGKQAYRRQLITQQSARCLAAYVYATAGCGESSTDLVFSGGGIIAENGALLAESARFQREGQLTVAEVDLQNLQHDRRLNPNFTQGLSAFAPTGVRRIPFSLPERKQVKPIRKIDPLPFVPSGAALAERCEEIFHIQVCGLAKRIEHIHAATAVIGISGGLDSTLALLVTALAFDTLKMPRQQILGVTMPGFGTTRRTYTNALSLIRSLGVSLREISIREACLQHFKDIKQDPDLHDVTYENSQARERTQVLMDLANKENGLVVGTGDLSELALGWATYNGDHISMYGVNTSIPKTLVRSLVEWAAHNKADAASRATLLDIADTPISPELIPADAEGRIAQKTEDLVGPYELHDFFLYHFLRFGAKPKKIGELARLAFDGKYSKEEIDKWLRNFFRRFFSQQFKRSCLPDGPKVGSVSLSPRSDWRMPSDASARLWLEDL